MTIKGSFFIIIIIVNTSWVIKWKKYASCILLCDCFIVVSNCHWNFDLPQTEIRATVVLLQLLGGYVVNGAWTYHTNIWVCRKYNTLETHSKIHIWMWDFYHWDGFYKMESFRFRALTISNCIAIKSTGLLSVQSFTYFLYVHIGFLWVLWVPPALQKPVSRWIGYAKLLLGMIWVYGVLWWPGVPCRASRKSCFRRIVN